jgi:3-ketosteroid 9alpha-monooxygenase subunit B
MTARPQFHQVQVVDVIEETPDARTLVLLVPPGSAAAFAYRPGQFLTVRVPHHTHGFLARCYSLSSSPHTDRPLRITVKRVRDGHASNWICDHVAPGSVLDVLPPAGSFTPASHDEDLLLFAGGSGITPVMSIIRTVLAEGQGKIALVYANRDEPSVIFAAELRKLAADHPDRLQVHHWLDVEAGPPTVDGLDALVRPYQSREVFLCGPEPFMAVVQALLDGIGVPAEKVHIELFRSAPDEPPAPDEAVRPERVATAEVTLDGQTHHLPWPARTRLLDVLLDAGLNPPYSCRQGICGACACRVLDGDVQLLHNEVLESEDFADGYTLACQALPVSDTISVTYS